MLGVAYKADLDDCRESPALEILRLLRKDGAQVRYHDSWVPELTLAGGETAHSEPLTPELLAAQDLVLIATNHSGVDYEEVVRHARQVLDTRNATRGVAEGREKITLL